MIIHRSLKCLIRIYNALILTFYFIKPLKNILELITISKTDSNDLFIKFNVNLEESTCMLLDSKIACLVTEEINYLLS